MTVGERIQKYRKNLGMSQEELGQKLMVSRQTISLWEKDQTLPTIDNLVRLKEIFGVSVDAILEGEADQTDPEIQPVETYQFRFEQTELKEVYRISRRSVLKTAVVSVCSCAGLLVLLILSKSGVAIFLGLGMLLFTVITQMVNIVRNKKEWKYNLLRISESTYKYQILDNYLNISIFRNADKIWEAKCDNIDIQQIRQTGKWLLLRILGQTLIFRQKDLQENSALYSLIYGKSSKSSSRRLPKLLKLISWVLFAAAILSFAAGFVLAALLSDFRETFANYLWINFVMVPIPVASIIFGIFLKHKGYSSVKNIIVGIIMSVVLCVYGSFSFMYTNIYDYSSEPIERVERMLEIDIPEHDDIMTLDMTKGTQSNTRGYIYYVSDVYFRQDAIKEFEWKLPFEKNWMSSVPSSLIGITSQRTESGSYDYILIYNTDTAQFNSLPEEDGTYHFINILYRHKDNHMQIIEYDIEYIR